MIALRECTPADMPQLEALARDTFTETFGHLYDARDLNAHLDTKCSVPYFIEALSHPPTRIIIAWEGRDAVGYIKWGALELDAGDGPPASAREIHRLYVRATHQKHGIGKQLLEYALAACSDAAAIYLSVWEHNEKAQRFYARYGFVHAGEHIYYVGTAADRDLIWRKNT